MAQLPGYTAIYQADTGFVGEIKKTLSIRLFDPLSSDPNASAISKEF